MFDIHNIQNEKNIAILKIRSTILNAARCWLNQHNYTEVQGPTIIPAVGDWPTHFEVKYYDKKAYLAQGLQPYTNAFVASLGKVYTIAPTFRAEKAKTQRHLSEYWRIEVAQQCDLDTIIEVQEKLVTHICYELSKETTEELKCLKRNISDLAKIRTPFPQLTYDEVIDKLQREGFNLFWGQKIDWELENHLSLKFNQPFFITNFPVDVETLFHKSNPEKPELTLSADMLAPEGYGEISSCLQMLTEKKVISKRMAEEDIHFEDQAWYLSLIDSTSFPRSGFAIGLERFIQWICKLEYIKGATAFPRLYGSYFP